MNCNRMLIAVLACVIGVGVGMAFALEWSGRSGAAAFLALGTTALGLLCPSPLRAYRQADPAGEAFALDGISDRMVGAGDSNLKTGHAEPAGHSRGAY